VFISVIIITKAYHIFFKVFNTSWVRLLVQVISRFKNETIAAYAYTEIEQ